MHLFQKYSLTRRIYILFSLTIALSLTTSLIFYFSRRKPAMLRTSA